MKKTALILLCAATLLACSENKKASIKGHFTGVDKSSIYLEIVTTSGRKIVDSTTTNQKGDFKFKFNLPSPNPTFYNVKCNKSSIPLIVLPAEKIKLNSICNIQRNYTIEGSNSSVLLKQFNDMLLQATTSLDSLSKAFGNTSDAKERQELTKQYTDCYYKFKRDHIKFIIDNATDMSAVFALYQRLPGDRSLFNGTGDIIYYKMVADSIENHYPTSDNLKALREEIAQSESVMAIAQQIKQESEKAVGFPDLVMQDIYGKARRLSDVAKGKVTLIDFWNPAIQESAILNAELRELYNKWGEKGFEIYQISTQTNKSEWILIVQGQKLPWVSVCDLKGSRSSALPIYNISSLPANVLIDRNGDIIARNIYGKELAKKVAQLVK